MDLSEIQQEIPFKTPVQPVQLDLHSEFRFDCHPGVPCFNECCRNIDIQLTPYDIIRLKGRLELSAGEFVARHTVPFGMDHHGLPGLRMLTKPGTAECVFLGDQGCTVYEDRPAACRYYALGSMAVRKKESAVVEDMFFVVKEPHCRGHEEPKKQTVRDYRASQGADKYDDMNREWRDVIIKKRSSGPTVGAPSERSMQLFDMCSYDMDSFREFIQTESFNRLFDLDEETRATLLAGEEALLAFSMRFLKQTLFGEKTIPMKDGARAQRIESRRTIFEERRRQAVESHRADQADEYEAIGEGR